MGEVAGRSRRRGARGGLIVPVAESASAGSTVGGGAAADGAAAAVGTTHRAPSAGALADDTGTGRPAVRGLDLDPQTRCRHWHSPRDIVAIRMACCSEWYACADCHAALADHPLTPWPAAAFGERAIRCGACGAELTIAAYLAGDDACPACAAPFNPGCRLHRHLYFAA
ncbi:MAG: hypothetical protein JO290_04340 [Sphingomonadaceae bacterium]|nr:hypothetical protein [Sphingomonadaceae bacterium]